jgi:hypothetical protein
MTPLEDMVRAAICAKADQIPPDTVPPLQLPARRSPFLSFVYGGRREKESAGTAELAGLALAPAASAVLVAAVIAGSLALSHAITGSRAPGRHSRAPR